MEGGNRAEAISKVLYPADDHIEGKSLRLKQQYFFVSASLQNIVQIHLRTNPSLDNLAEKAIVHINDTHPALCVPELMRILLDDYGYSWEKAWDITCHTLAYTNHTVMSEALEKWDIGLFRHHLPRITSIVEEINRRFCSYVYDNFPEKRGAIAKMAAIGDNQVRMANLCLICCFSVNGVSKLHSDILKNDLFKDFNDIYPGKLTNVTNGITARRWLNQGNPLLADMITGLIGDGYVHDLSQLSQLKKFMDDSNVLEQLGKIKLANKDVWQNISLRTTVSRSTRTPSSTFRSSVCMNTNVSCSTPWRSCISTLRSRRVPVSPPRTFIFGAKASAGYYMAKEIIRLSVQSAISSTATSRWMVS